MKKIFVNLWLIFLLAALCDCGRHSGSLDQLERAQVVMEERPDSALAILARIDTASLASPRERALYGLYLTNARYLAYDPEATDSLLSANSAYLSCAPSPYDRMLYHYLSGVMALERGEYESSLTHLLEAIEPAESLRDSLYLGKIYREIGCINTAVYNNGKALHYHKLASKCFENVKKPRFKEWQWWEMAQAYYNLNELDSCMMMLDKAQPVAIENKDECLVNTIHRTRSHSFWKQKLYDKSKCEIESITDDMMAQDYYILSFCCYKLGIIDSADYYNIKLLQLDPRNLDMTYRLSKSKSNLEEAITALERSQNLDIQRILDTVNNRINEIEDTYQQSRIQSLNHRERKRFSNLLMFGIVLLAIFLLFMIVTWRKAKTTKRKTIHYISLIEKLNSELNSLPTKVEEEKRLEINTILKKEVMKRYEILNEVCSELYSNQISLSEIHDHVKINQNIGVRKDSSSKALRRISNLIQSFKPSHENFTQLEDLVNSLYDNAATKLKEVDPDLYEKKGDYFVYRVLGLPIKTIAVLMNESEKTVYNYLQPFKKKLEDLDRKNGTNLLNLIKK